MPAAPSRLLGPIDENAVATLKGNVRRDVAKAPDLGPVEDAKPLHLFLLLQRTPAQQADLENLIARQQQPTAQEYHKWLTPAEFGARFGASPEDIAKINTWLESHGMEIRSVLNNASMIDFAATAGQVRAAFHTQLHYVSMRGGQYPALIQDPQIPAALAPVVAGIAGLNKIPLLTNHTEPRQASRDEGAHSWHIANPANADMASPTYTAGGPYYDVTPQDLYTIYNINPVFTGENLAATATVAVIEESDIEYGTVDSTTGVATGGDVATFRTLFGVPGTLNMHVYHGYGTVTCTDPGIDPSGSGEDIEASLDAEWINATAPSANLIFMSCGQSTDQGIWNSMSALIDNNLSDVMSLSYGGSELNYTSSSDYDLQDTLYAQAATQGQSILISSGDSGSDVADQNTSGTATYGINVSALGSPMVTVTGGTDFSDYYDAYEGGPAQSTYWSSTNSTYYGDALSYVPETAWNDACASSILAEFYGSSGAGLCATGNYTNRSVVGGSGGISTHYGVPSWQTGTSGYSNSMHSQPDIAGFASAGFWGHGLIFCDSNPSDSGSYACTSSNSFGEAGGTSFVAPYMAGVFGLLRTAAGERQGVLNPALYALAKAQYTAPATETACYANGQTSNAGITTGLPAASCIFNDITTSNNDVPCAAGSTSCYVNSGASYGMLSLAGSSSLSVAYSSEPGFDQVTGLGSINVANLISKWNTVFTSSTAITANPTSISSGQSTTLKATVTGGTPTGYVDPPPALSGTATFKAGTTVVGSCTLSSGTCSISVPASSLQTGANSMTATFAGSGTYPSSTSSSVPVTVASATLPSLTSPSSSPLSGTTMFTWNPGSGSSMFALWIGTSPGTYNVYSSGHVASTVTSETVNIPANGATLYVSLWYEINGNWSDTTYIFTEGAPPSLTSPSSSPLSGSTQFTWNPGSGSTMFALWIGTAAGTNNLYTSGHVANTVTSETVNIPANGATLYVSLWYEVGGVWSDTTYTFTEGASPSLTSPTSSPLSGSTQFTWNPGSGSTMFALWIGTAAGTNNFYTSGHVASTITSETVNIPANGATLYVSLWYEVGGVWSDKTYTFTEAQTPSLTSPSSSPLSGSTNFTWSPGSGSTMFALWIGTAPGTYNVFTSGHVASTVTSETVNIPANGATLYVSLWYELNGNWTDKSYTFTEAP